MRNVETSVAGVIFMLFGLTIAADMIAVEISAVTNLTVTTDTQTASCM